MPSTAAAAGAPPGVVLRSTVSTAVTVASGGSWPSPSGSAADPKRVLSFKVRKRENRRVSGGSPFPVHAASTAPRCHLRCRRGSTSGFCTLQSGQPPVVRCTSPCRPGRHPPGCRRRGRSLFLPGERWLGVGAVAAGALPSRQRVRPLRPPPRCMLRRRLPASVLPPALAGRAAAAAPLLRPQLPVRCRALPVRPPASCLRFPQLLRRYQLCPLPRPLLGVAPVQLLSPRQPRGRLRSPSSPLSETQSRVPPRRFRCQCRRLFSQKRPPC